MVRTPSCDKSGLRKGTWTPEEDRKLVAYVTRYGSWNWRQLPRFAGLARCGKSCRLRWMNYLRPNLKRGNFTQAEEECIIKLHAKLGNRWSAIAARLPGRTDNEIKNHWHTNLKKRFQQNTSTNEEQPKASKSKDKETTPEQDKVANNGYCSFQVTTPAATISQISDSTTAPLSPLSSSSSELSSISSSDHTTENFVIEDDDFAFLDGSFWNEPYLTDILHTPSDRELVPSDGNNGAFQSVQDTTTQIFDACAISLPNQESNASLVGLENEFGSLLEPHTEPTVESFWTQPFVSDVAHLPSELLTPPFAGPSEYFSPLCGADLWSTQSNLYDEQLSLF